MYRLYPALDFVHERALLVSGFGSMIQKLGVFCCNAVQMFGRVSSYPERTSE